MSSDGEAPAGEPLGVGIEEPPDRNGAFPRLDDDQRARLLAIGDVRQVASGELLFQEGDDSYDFFVVESGAVAIVRGYGTENHVIAIHGPHRFLGELNLLTGGRVYLSAVVRDAGEVIHVPLERLRELVAGDEELSNLILRAYLARRSLLIEIGGGVRVIGSRYSPDTRRLREFLARNRVPHHWVDLEDDEEAESLLRALSVSRVRDPGGRRGARGASQPLQRRAGRPARPERARGPAAAVRPGGRRRRPGGPGRGRSTAPRRAWTRRRSTRSRSAARPAPRRGSRTTSASPPASRAAELAERAQIQARRLGARMVVPAEAVGLDARGRALLDQARRRRARSTAGR